MSDIGYILQPSSNVEKGDIILYHIAIVILMLINTTLIFVFLVVRCNQLKSLNAKFCFYNVYFAVFCLRIDACVLAVGEWRNQKSKIAK